MFFFLCACATNKSTVTFLQHFSGTHVRPCVQVATPLTTYLPTYLPTYIHTYIHRKIQRPNFMLTMNYFFQNSSKMRKFIMVIMRWRTNKSLYDTTKSLVSGYHLEHEDQQDGGRKEKQSTAHGGGFSGFS